MNAYIDSSVLLRIALEQPNPFRGLKQFDENVSSQILKSECLRTLDRLASINRLSEDKRLMASEYLFTTFEHLNLVVLSDSILERVGEPLGLNLGTLDAIHLFSAVSWQHQNRKPLVFVTHDIALGKAAQFFGFEVLGL